MLDTFHASIKCTNGKVTIWLKQFAIKYVAAPEFSEYFDSSKQLYDLLTFRLFTTVLSTINFYCRTKGSFVELTPFSEADNGEKKQQKENAVHYLGRL